MISITLLIELLLRINLPKSNFKLLVQNERKVVKKGTLLIWQDREVNKLIACVHQGYISISKEMWEL